MKLVLLTRNRFIHASRRIMTSVTALGHTVIAADPLALSLAHARNGDFSAATADDDLSDGDVVMARISEVTRWAGLEALRCLTLRGMKSPASAEAMEISLNKFHTTNTLAVAGVPVPEAHMVFDRTVALKVLRDMRGEKFVAKTIYGGQGRGVILLESRVSAASFLEATARPEQPLLIQPFYEEARGRDVRVLVVGGKVIACARRENPNGDFRANAHQGGSMTPLRHPEFEELGRRAAEVLSLGIAGVDILETKDGPVVLEVNASPGFRGIEESCGVDVGAAFAHYLAELASAKPRSA